MIRPQGMVLDEDGRLYDSDDDTTEMSTTLRFPLADLVAAAGGPNHCALARRVGVTPRTVCRWHRAGLTIYSADAAAIAIGSHAAVIWPQHWAELDS